MESQIAPTPTSPLSSPSNTAEKQKACEHNTWSQKTVTDIPGMGWGDYWVYELVCTECKKLLATCTDNDHGVSRELYDEQWASRNKILTFSL